MSAILLPVVVVTGGAATFPSDAILLPAGATSMLVAGVPPAITGRFIVATCVPYPAATNSAVAILTNTARTNMARIATEGLNFEVLEFQAGRGGYDVADPTQATVPLAASVALIDPVFPTPITYELIDSVEYPNNSSVAFLCRIEKAEALYGLGELGIWATIINSPLFPAENGTKFLFAIAHVPLQGKTDSHVYGWRIVVAP